METPADTASLIALMGSGARVKFVFFWRHESRVPGIVDESCLSQWLPVEFTVDGVTFASAEHYMMWSKAKLFGDDATAARVLTAGHPGAAKSLGQQVRGFDEQVWKAERFGIVTAGNVAKFSQHPELRDYLLGTGERILVEASPLDRIWGIGMAADDASADEPARWRGLNLLGFALMRARDLLTEA